MKRERRHRSAREITLWRNIAYTMLGISVLLILASAIASGFEQGKKAWIPLLFGFGFLLLFLVIIFPNMRDIIELSLKQYEEKYRQTPLTILPDVSRERVHSVFQRHGFQKGLDGLYQKKVWSMVRSSMDVYLAWAEGGELSDSWAELQKGFRTARQESKQRILLLFYYKTEITQADQERLRDLAIPMRLQESYGEPLDAVSTIPILVDGTSGRGLYLAEHHKVTLYSYGCRLVRRYFRK